MLDVEIVIMDWSFCSWWNMLEASELYIHALVAIMPYQDIGQSE